MPKPIAISEMTEFQFSKDSLRQGDVWNMPITPFNQGSQFYVVGIGEGAYGHVPSNWEVVSIDYGLPGDVPLATLQPCPHSQVSPTIKMFVSATEGNSLATLVKRVSTKLPTDTALTIGGISKEQLVLIVEALNDKVVSLEATKIMADSISPQYASVVEDSINAHREVNDLVKEQLWAP